MIAALVIFGWGITHLFELRFAGGDVYPPYSSLRRDPLGAAAFYDALAALPNLRVERNLRPLAILDQPSHILLARAAVPDSRTDRSAGPLLCLYLGADADEWPYLLPHNEFARLDALMRQGGRLVLTFLPTQIRLTSEHLEQLRRDQDEQPAGGPPKQESPSHPRSTPKRQLPEATRLEDLSARWGIDFVRVDNAPAKKPPAKHDDSADAHPVAGSAMRGTGAVSWHSVLGFDLGAPAARAAGWRALYQQGDRSVIVARPVGNQGGELILASDSYFLSNEALRAESRPALLAGLIGPARHVIFDETHFGVTEQPGMMTLARRYGLQGGLAALGLLAVLFIWRNVVSLVPPAAPLAGSSFATASDIVGRDAAAGFLNLLHRGVPPRALLTVCLEQWRQTARPTTFDQAAGERLRVLAAEEEARPASRRNLAVAYRAMCAALRIRL